MIWLPLVLAFVGGWLTCAAMLFTWALCIAAGRSER